MREVCADAEHSAATLIDEVRTEDGTWVFMSAFDECSDAVQSNRGSHQTPPFRVEILSWLAAYV
jgi:hypothetical protein